ncbi:MAG TPA: hypothetical protein VMB34_31065 [Acetobacteraceae bacterium]|nr:hypothetical protein [Acetobacteraceae bacterium]
MLIALVAVAIGTVAPLRDPVLRAMGWALVANQPVTSADIIVLSVDSGPAGALEAADLVHRGIAKRVAVFTDPPSEVDQEFIRRGLPYDDEGTRQIHRLRLLGVTDVVEISRVTGSEDEGQVLPAWCDEHHFRAIIFVPTTDHSRRLRRMLHRAMQGHQTQVIVHAARYSGFDPNNWWKTRLGVRIEIVELEKLLLDVLLHPLSF